MNDNSKYDDEYEELSSLLTPSSSDGEMANILGYGERPTYSSHSRVIDEIKSGDYEEQKAEDKVATENEFDKRTSNDG